MLFLMKDKVINFAKYEKNKNVSIKCFYYAKFLSTKIFLHRRLI